MGNTMRTIVAARLAVLLAAGFAIAFGGLSAFAGGLVHGGRGLST